MNTHRDPQRRRAAGNLVRRAVLDFASAAGTQPGAQSPIRASRDIGPIAGLAASRQLELAAREHAAGFIRAAREAGYSWQDIGIAMELVPGGDAQQAGDSVARPGAPLWRPRRARCQKCT